MYTCLRFLEGAPIEGRNPTEVSGARWIRREARQFSPFLAETRVVKVCQNTTHRRRQITGKAVGINVEVMQSLQRQFLMAPPDSMLHTGAEACLSGNIGASHLLL